MNVFLDTNLLAGAAATRGLCADLLREVLASHDLLLSKYVLKELRTVLTRKLGVPSDTVKEFIEFLQQDAALFEAGPPPSVKLQDKSDLPVLRAALAGHAEVLVTGDKELLRLKRVDELEILSPRQFWERLKVR